MAVIVEEEAVVNVMVSRGAEAHEAEERVPRVCVFAVDKAKPRRIRGPEGHVLPHVAVDDVGSEEEREQDHAQGVHAGPVEGIEQLRVEEAVVWLVAGLVHGRAHLVLRDVHERLEEVHGDKLRHDQERVHSPCEGVVRRWHQPQHPRQLEHRCERKKSEEREEERRREKR